LELSIKALQLSAKAAATKPSNTARPTAAGLLAAPVANSCCKHNTVPTAAAPARMAKVVQVRALSRSSRWMMGKNMAVDTLGKVGALPRGDGPAGSEVIPYSGAERALNSRSMLRESLICVKAGPEW